MNTCHNNFNLPDQCPNVIYFLNNTENFDKNEQNFKSHVWTICFAFVSGLLLDTSAVKKAASYIILSEDVKTYLLSKLLSLFCLLISTIISPITFMIFTVCFIYRTMIHYLLKYKQTNYKGLLEGTDVVWAIEDLSKSVINILSIIEIKNIEEFKQKLTKALLTIMKNQKYSKLKHNRQQAYGYYYWIENNLVISEQIKYLPATDNCLNKKQLLEIISEYSNKQLPRNHTSSWEILIGKQKLENGDYPILFRFHHSIGDGLALMKILLEAADNKKETKQIIVETNGIKSKLLSFLQTILSIILVPGHLIKMNVMQTIDNSILHGKKLKGDKILSWIPEDENFSLLNCVKYIKSNFPGVSFSDVILAAFSETFCEYFARKNSTVPPSLTTVVVERAEKLYLAKYSTDCCHLQNHFSVAMMNLPLLPLQITSVVGCECKTIERLKEVNRQTKILKSASPEYQINYWLLKVVSKLLPVPILRPMLQSAHSTMIVSNIYGPDEITICDGHLIKDFIFWIPHRGLTGIGISVLSYAGRLELGINVDKALISNTEDVEFLLQNFVENLKQFSEMIKDNTAQKMIKE